MHEYYMNVFVYSGLSACSFGCVCVCLSERLCASAYASVVLSVQTIFVYVSAPCRLCVSNCKHARARAGACICVFYESKRNHLVILNSS